MSKSNHRKIKCPTCKKETTWNDNPFRPFCSERCKLIDLGQWADGSYRVETPGYSATAEEIEESVRNEKDKY
ncbi:MAG: DNA gyrase inhibitor YacG [SAR324 cluster bacterium]|uniref:DNA gyrase inhibitor YacG n=1 Tax=SAR324 cluster bacterium TaxID=2024889 RepID=A0A2A4SP12_9DELT|nr:MAG: DNA gyrase inhibitor YacG [SAR324 cluster bacterium]